MALHLASLTPKAKLFTRPQAVDVEVEREALGTKGPRCKSPEWGRSLVAPQWPSGSP